jgi:cytosine/uracil/thiamine/allantoin permease
MRAPAARRGLAAIGSEYRALDKVPAVARAFSLWDEAALWFDATSIPAAWLYGAIMAGWIGLPGTLVLVLVVSPLTLLPWSLLGSIAARTGAASVAILRPAFGLRGSVLPAACYLIFGFGWAAVNVFVGSIGTSFIFKGVFGTPALGEPGSQGPLALSILVAVAVVPLSLLPLVAGDLLGSYIFFLDVLGALVVPLWTIVLVDYFLHRRGAYADDLFRREGGAFWYRGGVHWPGVASLLLGVATYWTIAFGFPALRSAISATVPTIAVTALLYLWSARASLAAERAGPAVTG